jgi:alanine racemase
MGYSAPWEAPAIVKYRLTPAVHRAATVIALEEAASGLAGKDRVAVHIKVDTGLGRYGCTPEECLPLARLVTASPHLLLEGLMTHFAEADAEDLTFTREQLGALTRLVEAGRAEGIVFRMAHAAGSAGLLSLPDARLDMVRVGIMLSGQYPSRRLKQHISLRPALTFRARLARVFEVQPGESAGYGRTWRAERPTTVGLVPVGYADGYMRAISNRGAMLVRGRRCPVVGRVSMDQTTLDLGPAPGAQEGDDVVLTGRQGDEEITVDEVAEWAGTISYEVLTGLSARVPRRYLRDGQVVGTCDLLTH